MKKIRLDLILTQHHNIASREQAQRLIRAGKVLVNEQVIDKPGHTFAEDSPIRIQKPKTEFASRGGEKLQFALKAFDISVSNLSIADLGASNGGFTDCLLKHGAQKIYAIDVGRGQLAYELQLNPQVVLMDGVNCRYLTEDSLDEAVDMVVGDLSFISLKTILPAVRKIIKPTGKVLFLVKPQFEIGKGKVGKGGIVRHWQDHLDVVTELHHHFIDHQWSVFGWTHSPIQGKSGNIEFLVWLGAEPNQTRCSSETLAEMVKSAHDFHTNPQTWVK